MNADPRPAHAPTAHELAAEAINPLEHALLYKQREVEGLAESIRQAEDHVVRTRPKIERAARELDAIREGLSTVKSRFWHKGAWHERGDAEGATPDGAAPDGAGMEPRVGRVEVDWEDRLAKLRNCFEIQASPGNADANDYMHGMANGLALAVGIMTDREPAYIERPAEPCPAAATTPDGAIEIALPLPPSPVELVPIRIRALYAADRRAGEQLVTLYVDRDEARSIMNALVAGAVPLVFP